MHLDRYIIKNHIHTFWFCDCHSLFFKVPEAPTVERSCLQLHWYSFKYQCLHIDARLFFGISNNLKFVSYIFYQIQKPIINRWLHVPFPLTEAQLLVLFSFLVFFSNINRCKWLLFFLDSVRPRQSQPKISTLPPLSSQFDTAGLVFLNICHLFVHFIILRQVLQWKPHEISTIVKVSYYYHYF